MSVIQNMGVGAYDKFAETKRVFFRPSTSTDRVKVGDSVCYNWDISADHKERTVHPATGDLNSAGITAYAEGNQSYTGRLFIVEKPDSENLQNYAGVVKSLGPEAGGDGDMIEIFVPNGAIVPVRAGIYCYKGVTVLAVQDGSYSLETPVYGTESAVVAIAMETIDRTTDGLVWARLLGVNYFENGNYNVPLRTGDGISSGTIRVFERDISTRQTGGAIQATVFRTRLKGSGSTCPYGGALVAEVYVEGSNDAPLDGINAFHANVVLDPGCTVPQQITAVYARITEVAGFGGDKSSAVVAPLLCETVCDDENAASILAQMIFTSGGNDTPDVWFYARQANAVAQGSGGGAMANTATCALFLPVNIAGTLFYIPTFTDAELTG